MKKFLIFLVSIVVCVCVGMTTYYFLRNDETINFKTKEIYCNAGDVITLKDLGFERIKADKDTKINYNAGGDAVTNYVKYDSDKGYYTVGQNGGDVTLVIKTTNKKFKNFKVAVHIGNGTEANPYYIGNETTLSKIGQTYSLDEGTYYELRNDVVVSNNFKGIGYNANADQWVGFSGNFNGNGYTISGATLNMTGTASMGLFSTINETAVVENLVVKNVNVVGDYENAGILAGVINGQVLNVAVKNSEITTANANAKVGSMAGEISATIFRTSYAKSVTINANGTNAVVGGLFGLINETDVHACYASKINLVANNTSTLGGFVGRYTIGTTSGSILQSYANATSSNVNFAGFIGEINSNESFEVENASMLRYLIGNIAVSDGNVVRTVNVPNKADSTAFFGSFEDTINGYYLISNYANENDLILETELTYYEIDPETTDSKVLWDSNVWINSDNMLPELKMGKIAPAGVSGEYLRRNLSKIYINDASQLVQASDKEFVLVSDITLPQNWTPIDLNNVTINGKGFKIYFNDNGNTSVFGTVTDSTIKNIVLENVKLNSASNGALASLVTSTNPTFASTIENVSVKYTANVTSADNFGGLVTTAANAIVKNCSVTGLNVVGASSNVAGLIVTAQNTSISNCSVYATLTGKSNVAGVVVNNNLSTIANVSGNVTIAYSAETNKVACLAGVVASNNGAIRDTSLNVKIDVQNAGATVVAAGVTAYNNGTVTTSTIAGEGILISGSFDKNVVLGGVAAYNNGTIANTYCLINQVGSYREGRNDIVGGVAAYNNGTTSRISQVVASADLYGNTVGGVVVYMNQSGEAAVDQVLVAKFDKVTKSITDNTIKGDKFVAGVAVELSVGTISNIQTSSNIVGGTNETVSSLVVLVFPDGAKLANATINNSFEGNGSFFRETWKVATSTNTDEFGTLENDGRYNLYGYDAHVGSMHSVVINTEKASIKGVGNITKAEFTGSKIWVRLDYGDTEESSFYKTANNGEFANAATFKTDWVVNANTGLFGWGKTELRRQMTFDIGGVWAEVNGIGLSFLYV